VFSARSGRNPGDPQIVSLDASSAAGEASQGLPATAEATPPQEAAGRLRLDPPARMADCSTCDECGSNTPGSTGEKFVKRQRRSTGWTEPRPMRLLLRYITSDPRHPHTDASVDSLKNVLSTLGWLPTDVEFAARKLAEIIDRLPGTIRDQVAGANPILISTRPGTWGIVSNENRNRLHIRLLHDDLQTLREEAEDVARQFPEAFQAEFDRDLGFEPEVVIRRFDSEERMVAGKVQDVRNYGFFQYLKRVRRREFLTIVSLSILTTLSVASSVPMFLWGSSDSLDYWRGYLDRGATAFLTATLTILITMMLEYRAWSNLRVRIKWAFE
jgi:hypothetical protein